MSGFQCLEKSTCQKSFLKKCLHWSIDHCFFVWRLSKAADLDHHWVAKAWLSDVGLPQYSQAFHNHLVDGRMLNSLTRHDLERHLNITKKFHQISLLLGIELLQLLQFDKEVRKSSTQVTTGYRSGCEEELQCGVNMFDL